MVPLSRLRMDPSNPREMPDAELAKLVRSLSEFGFVQPVIARREDGLIIGGHQRLTAFQKLLSEQGKTDADVPVIYLDGLDDQRAKVLNLALNKIHGEWDYPKLSDMLMSLEGSPLLEVSGFELWEANEITALLGKSELDAPGLVDVDEGIAAKARRFAFTLETDEDATLCSEALKAYGMTGPGNAAQALVSALRIALGAKK